MKSHGVSGTFHYLPLHISKMGQQFGGKPGDCPVAEDVSDRLLRLPFYNGLTTDGQMKTKPDYAKIKTWRNDTFNSPSKQPNNSGRRSSEPAMYMN